MLTIIWGVVLSILFGMIAVLTNQYAVMIAALALLVIFTILGLYAPLSGYTDWELVKKIELIPFVKSDSPENKQDIYVILSDEYVYKYRYKIGVLNSYEYVEESIDWGKVEEVELSMCDRPVLEEYIRHSKKNLWTYGLYKDTQKVFIVPSGSILKKI